MNRTVTPSSNPPRARGDAFLTLNRRRGRIVFSVAAVAQMGLKNGNRMVLKIMDKEVILSVTSGCDGYILKTMRKGSKSDALCLFASAAVTFILSRCRTTENTVKIRLGERCGDGWCLLTSEIGEGQL